MLTLLCRDTGLDCDYIIEGETTQEILVKGAEHAMKDHGMKVGDLYLDEIPTNFLCQTIGKLADKNRSPLKRKEQEKIKKE
jgi:predicted small metal-binding protein